MNFFWRFNNNIHSALLTFSNIIGEFFSLCRTHLNHDTIKTNLVVCWTL